MRFVVVPVFLAACLVAASAVPVHAQVDSREGIALQNEIYQLRQELKSAEARMSGSGGSYTAPPTYAPPRQGGPSDLVAQLLTRVDALEDQVRELRGRIDETQNQLQQQNQDLGKRIDDLAFQINPQAGQAGASAPPTAGPTSGVLAPPPGLRPTEPSGLRAPEARQAEPSGPRTPEVALHEGNAALARRDYPAAEADARSVLANRTSPRAYDARLLLAQALAGERQFAQAAIAYDDAYNSSRKGSHAPDALLGLANSLSAINEKKAACDTLTRLHTDFPRTRADIAAGAAAVSQRTGCR